MLGGLDAATSGKIVFGDTEITALDDKQLGMFRAKDVGIIFQFYNLIPTLNAMENVALISELGVEIMDPMEALALVGLDDKWKSFPSQMSGGQQQRVSIARAVAKRPTMLLCDEPTGALDSKTGVLILNLLQDMSHNHNTTVIIVTHNAILAEAADKVIRIKNGQIENIVVNENPEKVTDLEW
jgi:putative ABC transport system ATP-binding protein